MTRSPLATVKAMTPLSCDATVAALRRLDPSGKKGSFEELVVRLLAKLLQIPVRRVGAGPQDGKDALSDDNGLAIECKRYGERTRLTPRHLITELEEARLKHPDLQLWVLVSTKALDARAKPKLDEAAHDKGLAVLYIDPVSVVPFLSTPNALVALCATDVKTSL